MIPISVGRAEPPAWARRIEAVVVSHLRAVAGRPGWSPARVRGQLIRAMRRAVADLPPEPTWLAPAPEGQAYKDLPYEAIFFAILIHDRLDPRSPMVGENAMATLQRVLARELPEGSDPR